MIDSDTFHAQLRSSAPRAARRRLELAVLTVALLALALLAPGSSLALPEGRVYEMVSPVYKAGFGATLVDVSPDGETAVFGSLGGFVGNPNNNPFTNYYIAHRSGSGWSTGPANVSAALLPFSGVADFSATLGSEIAGGTPGPSEGFAQYEGRESEYLLHDLALPDEAADFTLAGEIVRPLGEVEEFNPSYKDASPSLSHILFDDSPAEPILGEAENTNSDLYDLVSAGGPEPLRLVEVDNRKAVFATCAPWFGSGYGRNSKFNTVSADGEEIFFSVGLSSQGGGGGGISPECTNTTQVFMRVGGARTVEVSRPLDAAEPFGGCGEGGKPGEVPGEVPCQGALSREPAEFQGASENGDRVFFTTSEALVAGAVGNNLYMATIGCPGGGGESCEPAQREVTGLTQASQGLEPAEVQGVVAVAPDGSHVYFVARGVLSAGANAQGATPVKGADNLYVYDSRSSAAPTFIGDLCSGPVGSGIAEDSECPLGLESGIGAGSRNDTVLWTSGRREAQVNDCVAAEASCETGRFLLFSTYAQLAVNDTDTAQDVYRYDASTGALDRVSVGEGGSSENGNSDLFDATIPIASEAGTNSEQHDLDSRAITQDGSRIVFMSAEPLSPAATAGVTSAYEWHEAPGAGEGSVSLVSTGSSLVRGVLISSSGRDLFFDTPQGLVPQDTDGQDDVYDARIGGGFPAPPVEPEPCSGDACRGPLTNPAPLLVPGSVSQAPGANFAPPVQAAPKSGPKKSEPKKSGPKPKKRAKRKVKHRTTVRARRARRRATTANGRRGR